MIFKEGARIQHHSISAADGTFTIPNQEDFTRAGTMSALLWSYTDLCDREIGINEGSKRAYMRIGDEIKEIQLSSSTISTADSYYEINFEVGPTASYTSSPISIPFGITKIDLTALSIPTTGLTAGNGYSLDLSNTLLYDGTTISDLGTPTENEKQTGYNETTVDIYGEEGFVYIEVQMDAVSFGNSLWKIRYKINSLS